MEKQNPIPEETKKQMILVLREFVKVGVIGVAAENVGVPRRTHYSWMKKYPIYAKRFNEVREIFVDGLESIAIDRAKTKSDALLMMLLKAHRRDVYGDKTEMTHKGNMAAIQLIIPESMLNDEEKKLLSERSCEGEESDEQDSVE